MKSFLFSWTKFFTSRLVSATVVQTAKSNIVLVFKTIKPFHAAVKGEFSTTGSGAARACSTYTAVAATNTITLAMDAPYVLNETITLAFNPTKKGATVTQTVTNAITS
jgi:hypothetical protein